jgi:hypothetical protein
MRAPGNEVLEMAQAERAGFLFLPRELLGPTNELLEGHSTLADSLLQQRAGRTPGSSVPAARWHLHSPPPPVAASPRRACRPRGRCASFR